MSEVKECFMQKWGGMGKYIKGKQEALQLYDKADLYKMGRSTA